MSDHEIDLGITDPLSTDEHVFDVPDFPVATQPAPREVITNFTGAGIPTERSHASGIALQFGVTTDDMTELARIGCEAMNLAMYQVARAGFAFMRAKELLSMGHGGDRRSSSERSELENEPSFTGWLAQNGFEMQRAYEAMRIAKFVTKMPPAQLNSVLALGKSKVMLLASLSQNVIDKAVGENSELFEKADMMTVAELKAEIKAMQNRARNLESELERESLRAKRLAETKRRTTTYLLRTEQIREECMAFQYGCELNVNSLRSLFDEVNTDDRSLPEWRVQMEQVWVTAHVMAAQALDALEYVKAHIQVGDMPERIMGQHVLSVEEAERWYLESPMIKNEFEARKAMRAEHRDMAKPKGPGRPAVSKKAGE